MFEYVDGAPDYSPAPDPHLSLFLKPLKNLKPVQQLILSNCKCKNSHHLLSQSNLNIMRPHIHTCSRKAWKAQIHYKLETHKYVTHEYKLSFGTSLSNQMENDLLVICTGIAPKIMLAELWYMEINYSFSTSIMLYSRQKNNKKPQDDYVGR